MTSIQVGHSVLEIPDTKEEIQPLLNTGEPVPFSTEQADVQGNIAYFNDLFAGGYEITPYRNVNLLTNGGFEIWQRGNGPFTVDREYTADRWFFTNNNGNSTFSISRDSTNADNESGSCIAINYNHGSIVSDLYQKLEDINQLRNRTLSLSMRVKCSVPNAARIAIMSNLTQKFSQYHTGDATYQTLSVSIDIEQAATLVQVFVRLAATGTFYVDNAMLVLSDTPAPFTPMHPADDLARCQRYYESLLGPWGAGMEQRGAANALVYIGWTVEKAIIPTITLSNLDGVRIIGKTGTQFPATNFLVWQTSTRGAIVNVYHQVDPSILEGEAVLLSMGNNGIISVEANQ